MTFTEFLDLIKVIKMLYGGTVAKITFEKNIDTFYDLDSASLLKTAKDTE